MATTLFPDAALMQPAPEQKIKTTFAASNGLVLYMEYNGLQHSFRIRFNAGQRLFFFDTEYFQKSIFRNEYGVVIGQVAPVRANRGAVQVDEKRYRFFLSENHTTFSLLEPQSKGVLLDCTVAAGHTTSLSAPHRQKLMHCLLFAFAWSVK